jgi:hypothetical protein
VAKVRNVKKEFVHGPGGTYRGKWDEVSWSAIGEDSVIALSFQPRKDQIGASIAKVAQ